MIWLQVCTDAPSYVGVHFGISIMQMVRGVRPNNTHTSTKENYVAAAIPLCPPLSRSLPLLVAVSALCSSVGAHFRSIGLSQQANFTLISSGLFKFFS